MVSKNDVLSRFSIAILQKCNKMQRLNAMEMQYNYNRNAILMCCIFIDFAMKNHLKTSDVFAENE